MSKDIEKYLLVLIFKSIQKYSKEVFKRTRYWHYHISVAGGYTEWSQWTTCSESCGNGKKTRRRTCTNPPPSNGGQNCVQQKMGPAKEKVTCNDNPCKSKCFFLGVSDLFDWLDYSYKNTLLRSNPSVSKMYTFKDTKI